MKWNKKERGKRKPGHLFWIKERYWWICYIFLNPSSVIPNSSFLIFFFPLWLLDFVYLQYQVDMFREERLLLYFFLV